MKDQLTEKDRQEINTLVGKVLLIVVIILGIIFLIAKI